MNSSKINESFRDEWIKNVLENLPPGSKILDAGAGEQRYKKYCAHLHYMAQDFGQYDGQGNGKGLQTNSWDTSQSDIICDINTIPQPDHSFDAILCTEVFEHLPEPILTLKEFNRLLKINGILILTAPFCSLTHFAPFHFYTGYNKYFYEKFLPENGFLISEITHNGNFFDYLSQEMYRAPVVANNYCKKKPDILYKFASRIIQNRLQKWSDCDRGSKELLCFGFHIKAVKQGNNS